MPLPSNPESREYTICTTGRGRGRIGTSVRRATDTGKKRSISLKMVWASRSSAMSSFNLPERYKPCRPRNYNMNLVSHRSESTADTHRQVVGVSGKRGPSWLSRADPSASAAGQSATQVPWAETEPNMKKMREKLLKTCERRIVDWWISVHFERVFIRSRALQPIPTIPYFSTWTCDDVIELNLVRTNVLCNSVFQRRTNHDQKNLWHGMSLTTMAL